MLVFRIPAKSSTEEDECQSADSSGSSAAQSPCSRQRKRFVRHRNTGCSAKDVIVPLEHGCEDNWTWGRRFRPKEVILSGPNDRTVQFHPSWSRGTAAVHGKRPLNNGRFYWELHVPQRIFGTSVMFGIGTHKVRVHASAFRNILGEDEHGWGLSHKGLLWHKGVALLYTNPFKENQATVVGVLFDGIAGTLTYFKDGKCLGIAFWGLNKVKEPLYPIVSSTAAKTEMTLKNTRGDLGCLQDRCRAEVMKHIKSRDHIQNLNMPPSITKYLSQAEMEEEPRPEVDDYRLYDYDML